MGLCCIELFSFNTVAEQDLAAKSVDPAHLKSYHCPVCEQTLQQLTPIDILKHKCKHLNS